MLPQPRKPGPATASRGFADRHQAPGGLRFGERQQAPRGFWASAASPWGSGVGRAQQAPRVLGLGEPSKPLGSWGWASAASPSGSGVWRAKRATRDRGLASKASHPGVWGVGLNPPEDLLMPARATAPSWTRDPQTPLPRPCNDEIAQGLESGAGREVR